MHQVQAGSKILLTQLTQWMFNIQWPLNSHHFWKRHQQFAHTVLIPGTACNIVCGLFNGHVSSTNWVSYERLPGAWLFTCFGKSTLIGSDPLTTSCWDNRVGPVMLTYSTTLPHKAGLLDLLLFIKMKNGTHLKFLLHCTITKGDCSSVFCLCAWNNCCLWKQKQIRLSH